MGLDKNRQEVILKAGNKCCICTTPGIQAHHIIHKEHGGSDDLDNLAPLCPNCHSQIHTKGGFTLKIKPETLKRFRDNWYQQYEEKKTFFNIDDYNIKFIQKVKVFNALCNSKGIYASKSWELMFEEYVPKNLDLKLRADQYITYAGYGFQDLDDVRDSLKKIKYMFKIETQDEFIQNEFNEICEYFGISI